MNRVHRMDDKPRIPDDMVAKWQRVVDILAHLLAVPAGLIMKTESPKHNVFIASNSPNNPYDTSTSFTLNTELYCDTVMQEQRFLLVHDAREEPEWDQNPDLEHGMVFYMGFPLTWPDKSIFGTICVLDTKTNQHAIVYTDLLEEFKEVVNCDLQFLVEMTERKAAQHDLQKARDELEWRVQQRTEDLEEANTALKVLIERVEESKIEFEEKILANINELIIPYVEKLMRCTNNDKARAYIGILKSNINEITIPFASHLSSKFSKLTPTESEIAKLIMQGNTTKRIAGILNTATSTVDFHRNNIRKKIGISKARVNLRTYLTSES